MKLQGCQGEGHDAYVRGGARAFHGSRAGRAKGKGLDRVLGMWLLVEPTGDIT